MRGHVAGSEGKPAKRRRAESLPRAIVSCTNISVGGGGVTAWEEGKAFQHLYTRLAAPGILSFVLCFAAALRGEAA